MESGVKAGMEGVLQDCMVQSTLGKNVVTLDTSPDSILPAILPVSLVYHGTVQEPSYIIFLADVAVFKRIWPTLL
jgi:hypothetical protein